MGKSYQFVNLKGFPRGPRSKRNTLGAVMAEGLREATHTKHLLRQPQIDWKRIDSPVEDPHQFEAWLLSEMSQAVNLRRHEGVITERKLRSDALAVGTVIASWPDPIEPGEGEVGYDRDKFHSFAEETTDWFKAFLEPYEMMIHFRLEHYDEKYPHIHLWFTPYPNQTRTLNWSLASVCNGRKLFFHNLQKQFYEEVGHKYFDERARPYNERNPRVSRYEAVKDRERQEREAAYELKLNQPTYRLFSSALETLDKLNSGDEPFDEEKLTPLARRVLERYKLMPDIASREENNEVSTKAYDLSNDLGDNPQHETYSPGMLTKWNETLLFPNFFQVIRDNQSQSAHLDREDWLTIVIEETRLKIENDLEQMGLANHPIALEMLQNLGHGDFVTNLLRQSQLSIHEKAEALTIDTSDPDLRSSSDGSPSGSAWDSAFPR